MLLGASITTLEEQRQAARALGDRGVLLGREAVAARGRGRPQRLVEDRHTPPARQIDG